MQINTENYYQDARRQGQKEYSRRVSMGMEGYLPSLDEMLKNIEISSEKYLGVVDIPLKKIVGTYTTGRSNSFAGNFMPLLDYHTEFGQKWGALCEAHLTEGIREPVKVYEYLNWFYAMEGNKRVSVLKFFKAYSISGHVYRLIPKKDEKDLNIMIYYEFMEFYNKTGINAIWFTKRRSFEQLLPYIDEMQLDTSLFPNRYKYFCNSVYLPFRKIYLELGGQKLSITTGDAFLEYIKVYGVPEEMDDSGSRSRLSLFMTELEQLADGETVDIQTMPQDEASSVNPPTLSIFGRQKKVLKVAFVYDIEISKSSWSFSHEMGRNHVDNMLKDYITTSFIEGIRIEDAYENLSRLSREGNDVVFVTSPMFINATLKAALEFPSTKFLNCSETHSFKHVNTYFGRIYEPRFLAGMVAGISTKSNLLGYVGSTPHPGIISSINSFALGARMINPEATVKVVWESNWDNMETTTTVSSELIEMGADIISHHDTLSNREFSKEYGVYSVICNIDDRKCAPDDYIAAPVWNWGVFYEKMLVNMLNNQRRFFGSSQKVVNFWWGMDSGIVDFFYSKRLLPRDSVKLIDSFRNMITSGTFHPFTGPIYNQNGVLKIKPGQTATRHQIISMNWFVDIVKSELPKPPQRKGVIKEIMKGMLD